MSDAMKRVMTPMAVILLWALSLAALPVLAAHKSTHSSSSESSDDAAPAKAKSSHEKSKTPADKKKSTSKTVVKTDEADAEDTPSKSKKTDKTKKTQAKSETESKSEKKPDKASDKSTALATIDPKAYPDGGLTATEVAAELKTAGHKVKISKDTTGDPLIEASFQAGKEDVPYKVFFFSCKKGRCGSIQYYVALEGSPEKAQKWNEENRFARAYTSGRLVRFEYDVDLEEGATSKAVKNSAERWKAIMVAADSYLN